MNDGLVAQINRTDVNCEKSVAAYEICCGKGGEHQCNNQHRIQPFKVKPDPVDDDHAQLAESKSRHSAQNHLLEKHWSLGQQRLILMCNHGEKSDGEHIGHRIVTAAFEFEHRTQIRFERYAFGTQYGKNCGRVGRGYDGSQQQTFIYGEIGNVPNENPNRTGSEHHPHCRQRKSLPHYRLHLAPVGIETAGKKNEVQRNDTNQLSELRIVEMNATRTIGTRQHADDEEQNQCRHTELVRCFAGKD